MPIAARAASLWRQFGRNTPDSHASGLGDYQGFPANQLKYRVLWAFGADPMADPDTWTFTDISPYILQENKIIIFRGRRPSNKSAVPSTAAYTIKNPFGIFSKRNPLSPYWGQLNQQIPMRVEVNVGSGWNIRYTGFINELPPQQDTTGTHRFMQITAAGHLRRMTQGKAKFKTAAYRGIQITRPAAYWSLNTGSLITEVTSDLLNGDSNPIESAIPFSMTANGNVRFGAVDGWPGSPGKYPELFGAQAYAGSLTGTIDYVGGGAGYSVGFWFRLGRSTEATSTSIGLVRWSSNGTFGGAQRNDSTYTDGFSVYADHFSDGTEQVVVSMQHPSGPAQSLQTPDTVRPMDGNWHHIHVEVDQLTPSLVRGRFYYDGTLVDTEDSATFVDAGQPTSIRLSWFDSWNPTLDVFLEPFTSLSIGEVAVFAQPVLGDTTYVSGNGHIGEEATTRYARLCDQEGLAYSVIGSGSLSATMGPQGTGTFLEELEACEGACAGVIDEDLYSRLRLTTPSAYYNQGLSLTIDKAANELLANPKPRFNDDDLNTRNQWEISRPFGPPAARFVELEGPLGVNSVGLYDDGAQVNSETDTQSMNHAAWRVSKGTVDEIRVDSATVLLATNPHLIQPMLSCDIGAQFRISNPSIDLPPFPLDETLIGYTETVDPFLWQFELYGNPSLPYSVTQLNVTGSRLDSSTSTVNTAVASGATSILVTVTGVLWEVASYTDTQILIDGELMTLSSVSGASSPQTFTVVRSIAKNIPVGVAVSLFRARRLAF